MKTTTKKARLDTENLEDNFKTEIKHEIENESKTLKAKEKCKYVEDNETIGQRILAEYLCNICHKTTGVGMG